MPNRILKESIKYSEKIDKLTWFEEVVFYRLLVSADDYGCMDGRPVLLKNELFPLKETVTKKAIEDAISRLASVGLLCRYTVSGKPYLALPSWERHQRIRNKHRKYPEPPAECLNVFDSNSLSNDSQMTADRQPESESEYEVESPPSVSPPAVKKTRRGSDTQFRPPTLEEVTAYCRERSSPVNPKRFYDYFSTPDDQGRTWHDSEGKPVRNWKQRIISWENGESTRKRRKAPTAQDMSDGAWKYVNGDGQGEDHGH